MKIMNYGVKRHPRAVGSFRRFPAQNETRQLIENRACRDDKKLAQLIDLN